MEHTFKEATAAGTFDFFHKGHETFLLSTFTHADTVHIAITTDEFVRSTKQTVSVSPFKLRKKSVEDFLKKNHLAARAHIFELSDLYGPTLDPQCSFEAIIVTKQSQHGATLINKLRAEKNLFPLKIVEVPFAKAEDNTPISSSRIRNGEIDRSGKLWVKPEWLTQNLILPESLRPILQKPLGTLFLGDENHIEKAMHEAKNLLDPQVICLVTIGDIAAQSCNKVGILMDLAVVDFQVKRRALFNNLLELGFLKSTPNYVVENPKGIITKEAVIAIKEFFTKRVELSNKKPFIIQVTGEEDLTALIVILAAPLYTHVFYGQPNEGIVDVTVTEEKKEEVRNILSQFTH